MSKVPIGHLDLVGADRLEGWAGLRGQQEPVVVEIYLDQEKVWECLADHPRPDVERAGLHFERCGFVINDQAELTWADEAVYQTTLELFRRGDGDSFRLAS